MSAGESKTVVHWGQRKLLMHEIEFLTKHLGTEQRAVLVYAGAAPGTHISLLSDLFPSVVFVSQKEEKQIAQNMHTMDITYGMYACMFCAIVHAYAQKQ